MEGPACGRCETLHRSLATVIGGNDIASLEVYLIICPWAEVAILVDHLGCDEGEVLALVIDTEADVIGGPCSADGLGANGSAVLTGDDLDFARGELHAPRNVVWSTKVRI